MAEDPVIRIRCFRFSQVQFAGPLLKMLRVHCGVPWVISGNKTANVFLTFCRKCRQETIDGIVEFQKTQTLEEVIFKTKILKGECGLALKPRVVLHWSFWETVVREY